MKEYSFLNYIDGDFILIPQPTVTQTRMILPLLSELKNKIAEEKVDLWPVEIDALLFTKYRRYYQKIGDVLKISEVAQIVECDRHQFFVCTEPVIHNNKTQLGISWLEQLLGFSYETKEGQKEQRLTTHDPFLDVVTHALLVFKCKGLEDLYSLNQLNQMCKLAGDLHDAALNKKEFIDENLEIETEDQEFSQIKDETIGKLAALGVEIPGGF